MMRGWGRPGYQAGIFTEYGYSDMYPGDLARVQANALILRRMRAAFLWGMRALSVGSTGKDFEPLVSLAKDTWEDVRNVDCLLSPDSSRCSAPPCSIAI